MPLAPHELESGGVASALRDRPLRHDGEMPVALFYAVALLVPSIAAAAIALTVRNQWRLRPSVPPAAKWLLGVWILISLLAIGAGGLAALAISIARSTTPARANHLQAAAIVLSLIALQCGVGFVLRLVLRSARRD